MRRGQLRCSFILAMRAYPDLERDHSPLSDKHPRHLALQALLANILNLLESRFGPLNAPNINQGNNCCQVIKFNGGYEFGSAGCSFNFVTQPSETF